VLTVYIHRLEELKVQANRANCPSFEVCLDWGKYQKNMSILLVDTYVEMFYDDVDLFTQNSKPLVCSLEEGVISKFGL
jgi:hypothetical protein